MLLQKQKIIPLIAIFYTLAACGQTELETNLQKVKEDSLKNFIFAKGGTFTMGDFGVDKDGKHYRLSFASVNAPRHQVTLSSYSLSKYQVTWFDYDTFLLATNRPVQAIRSPDMLDQEPIREHWKGARTPYEKNNDPEIRNKIYYYLKPASVQWQDASDYCQWLGQQLNLPIDLPTEAQWEYAARSGGYNVLYANQKGDIHNPPMFRDTSNEPELIAGMFRAVPVGTFSTPNHLGFYDMDNNGFKWVNDWYSATYYKDYPEIIDPKGPEAGNEKVVRGGEATFDRSGDKPSAFNTFRCAVNSDKPINSK